MSARHLWRIANLPSQPAGQLDTLAAGLRTHLHFADLQTTLVQIGGRQQAYVALGGCAGCVHGRCVLGCRTELLRRLIQGTLGPQVQLQIVRKGLVRRPYREAWLLCPMPSAEPLDGDALRGLPEARLTLDWSHHPFFPEQLTGAGLLLSSVETKLKAWFRACGWHALPVRQARLADWLASYHTRSLHLRGPWEREPHLLLPVSKPVLLLPPGGYRHTAVPGGKSDEQAQGEDDWSAPGMTALVVTEQPAVATSTEPGRGVAESARRWLEAVRDRLPLPRPPQPDAAPASSPQPGGKPTPSDNDERDPVAPAQAASMSEPVASAEPTPTVHAAEATPAPDDAASSDEVPAASDPAPAGPAVSWPAGPGQMQPYELAHLIELCLASPAFIGGERPGVSKKRLGAVLPVALAEHSAQLMVWLGRAGVLADPLVPAEPWRNPRLLRSADAAWLAAALTATPIPTLAEAQAALRQQSL
jgi:hypothetical protein